MIYQVLDVFDTKLRDTDVGINARVAAVNTAYSTALPRIDEILTWDQTKLPSQMKPNALLLVWEAERDMELIQQGKWNGSHLISLQWFHRERSASYGSKNAALVASALRSFLDYMAEVPEVLEIRDPTMQVAGWVNGKQLFRWVSLAFRVKERDEAPIIVNDP